MILTPFPFTDLSSRKVRPAVIISENISEFGDIIICFISSIVSKNLTSFDISISNKDKGFEKSGLKFNSVIKPNKIATIDKDIVIGKLGELDEDLSNRLNEELKKVLGLNFLQEIKQ